MVNELAIEQTDVNLSCRILGVSRSGYYKWLDRPIAERKKENTRLAQKIKHLWGESRETYGAPRIHKALKKTGERVGKKRVAKIMKNNGLAGAGKKKFKPQTTTSKHNLPVADRVFKVEDSKEKVFSKGSIWVGDITYIQTDEGFAYLSAFMDLSNREIVGHYVGDTLHTEIVTKAFDDATGRHGVNEGLVVHTDRGSQYAATSFRDRLSEIGALPSMSRKGNCYDNAFMESFFRTLKVELVHRHKFKTIAEARMKIFEYIEVWYNRKRMHSSLDYLSPVEYKKINYALAS